MNPNGQTKSSVIELTTDVNSTVEQLKELGMYMYLINTCLPVFHTGFLPGGGGGGILPSESKQGGGVQIRKKSFSTPLR